MSVSTETLFTKIPMEDELQVADAPICLKSFPLHALNESQHRAVEAIATTFQQDPALSGMASLAALGGAIGKSFRVTGASNYTTGANVYVIAAAERSYGKGASGAIMRPIIQRNSEIQMEYRQQQIPELKSKKAIAEKWMKAAIADERPDREKIQSLQAEIERCDSELKTPPSIYVGSATGPAMVEAMARNGEQILSYSPEAGDMIRVALGRYSKDDRGDFDLYLSGYSGEPFSENRIGRGLKHLAEPCLLVCWLVQPTLLRELLGNEDAIERGLAARGLYISIAQEIIPLDDGTSRELNSEDMLGWESILNRALDRRANKTVIIACDPEAREIFRAFHNETVGWRNGVFHDIQGELGRARENAIRLALGQCVADALEQETEPNRLTDNHAQRGVALARYSYDQFLRLLEPAREEKRLKRVEKLVALCDASDGTVTLRDLKIRNGFKEGEVRRLASAYPAKLEIIKKPSGTQGGRPSESLTLRSF